MQLRVFAIPMDGDDEATEEMNRRAVPAVRDRVRFAVGLYSLGGEKPTVAEFLKQRLKPTVTSKGRARFGVGEFLGGCPK